MRVLQLLSSTGFHGAETMTAELVRQLDRLGVIVDIGVLDNAGRADRTILDAVAPHIREGAIVPCAGQLDFRTLSFLREYRRTRGVDVFHSHKYKTTFYGIGARTGSGTGLIATYHNWLTDTLPLKFYAALDKRLARCCDAAVGVSLPVTEELKRRAPRTRVLHIGNGIDADKFQAVAPRAEARRRLGLPDVPLIGFVGRLAAAKGLSYLLPALLELPAACGAPHLVITGDGEYRTALERETALLGLGRRVHLLGNRHDTPLIYSALDVFVLPSFVEAFPMVVLEAMACGVPVVATSVGDIPQMIPSEVSGLVVPPGDSTAMAEAIARILTDIDFAQRLAQQGPPRVRREFSSQAMARTYLSLYEEVLRERRGRNA